VLVAFSSLQIWRCTRAFFLVVTPFNQMDWLLGILELMILNMYLCELLKIHHALHIHNQTSSSYFRWKFLLQIEVYTCLYTLIVHQMPL
jgi:hypothetical protein